MFLSYVVETPFRSSKLAFHSWAKFGLDKE